MLRERFHRQGRAPGRRRLTGENVPLRAELFVAQLIGLGAALAIDHDGPAATAEIERIADLYAPALQSLVNTHPIAR